MREMSKRRYLMAFILTAAIFFLGFFFGFLMDLQRTDFFQVMNEQNKLNIQSLQLQNELVQTGMSPDKCAGLRYLFDNNIADLERNRERIELYSQQANVAKDDFDNLKRQYTISQLNFFLLSKKLEESCPLSVDFVRVLYFYSTEEKCPKCEDQANVLNYYKRQLQQKILIFALDETFEQEPAIKLLKESYGITEYPSIVVEDATYYGFISQDTLGDIFCSNVNNPQNTSICAVD